VDEAMRYVKLGGGRCGAQSGGHDDEVAVLRLASAMLQEFGIAPKVRRPRHHRKADEFHSTLRTKRRLR
jgi:hypothetical protein